MNKIIKVVDELVKNKSKIKEILNDKKFSSLFTEEEIE